MIDGGAFFQKMWETDVLGRTDGTLHNNIAPFTYYAEYFLGAMSGTVTPYLCAFVICLIGLFLFSKSFAWKNRGKYIGWVLWILVPFVGFSLVTNKLLWYMYPVLVPLLLSAGIMCGKILKNRQVLLSLRCLFAGVVVLILLCYTGSVYGTIDAQEPNEFQELVKEVAASGQYNGCEVFVDYNLNEDGSIHSVWSQQDVFVAEAYGDFRCVKEGYMGLMLRSTITGETGIVFVGEDVYEEYGTFYKEKEIAAQSEHYYALLVQY
jgi:hypothetical protein